MVRCLPIVLTLALLPLVLGQGSQAHAQRHARVSKTNKASRTVKSPARKTRVRRSASNPATKLRNAMPKRIGQGFFSRVYRSNDGNWVIKKMLPAIAGVEKVSRAERHTMAQITVKVSEALRKAGLPVPRSYIPKGKQGVLVQRYSEGLPFAKLQGKAKFEASKNQMVFFGKASRAAKLLKGHDSQWYIDKNRNNLLFNKEGKITSWIDPVVPTRGVTVQRAIDKLRAAEQ